MTTLSSELGAVAARSPDRAAAVGEGGQLTYAELDAACNRIAGRLGALGLRPGAKVALLLPNSTEFAAAFYAVARFGGVVLPLNPSLREPEVVNLLADAGASALVTTEPQRDFGARTLIAAGGGTDEAVIVPGEGGSAEIYAEAASGDDSFLYLYSSGSTGRPKRIERTHAQLLFETRRLIAALGLSPEDRVLGVTPFSHINGLMRSMVASTLAGATLFPIRTFERRTIGTVIDEYRITGFIGVPFMYAMLAETRWRRPVDFSSLRYCFCSSAPLRADTWNRFHERFGLCVRQLYGTTETGTIALNLDEPPEAYIESVGRPIDGVSVEIFSKEKQPLGAEEVGEIGIKSPAATSEYPGLMEESRQAFRGGYFFPGDIGRKDFDGRVYLLGRKSFFINRGGYKVNQYELEELIDLHPKVRESVVVGVETRYGDEIVKVIVVPSGDCEEREIVEHCRGKVADFKIPSVVEFRSELPKSVTGKVQRKGL